MPKPLIFTPTVEASCLSDGTEMFVASLEELPGVVCEGESRESAISELIATVQSMRERMKWGAVGFRTTLVQDWEWTMYEGSEKIATFGPEDEEGEPWSDLPDNYRELQPLA